MGEGEHRAVFAAVAVGVDAGECGQVVAGADVDGLVLATVAVQVAAGQAAVDKGELRRGRALFLSSLELHPAVGTLLNLADCEEKLGLIASAWRHFKDARPLMRDGDGRIVGVIGFIGPTRLNYARVIPMVDYTARVVSRLLAP